MKDKIERVKQFAKENSSTLLYTSGVLTGVALTTFLAVKHPRITHWRELEVFVNDTPEQLLETIQKSGGFALTNPDTQQRIQIGVLPALAKLDL